MSPTGGFAVASERIADIDGVELHLAPQAPAPPAWIGQREVLL
jgi:hypothetical protein